MAFNLKRISGAFAASGNLNTFVAGTTTGMGSCPMNDVMGHTLAADISLTAATATITLTVNWQVSLDGTNWLNVAGNPSMQAATIFATGTLALKRVVMEAPSAVYAYPYVRVAVTNGVATGAAGDLYAVTYSYVRNTFT